MTHCKYRFNMGNSSDKQQLVHQRKTDFLPLVPVQSVAQNHIREKATQNCRIQCWRWNTILSPPQQEPALLDTLNCEDCWGFQTSLQDDGSPPQSWHSFFLVHIISFTASCLPQRNSLQLLTVQNNSDSSQIQSLRLWKLCRKSHWNTSNDRRFQSGSGRSDLKLLHSD